MIQNICTANFSVSNFEAGASTLTSMVAENYVISGYRLLVENVSGGSATITAQFWQGAKPLGKPASLKITDSSPSGNSITAPKNATMVVINFEKITFPMGTVILSVTSG